MKAEEKKILDLNHSTLIDMKRSTKTLAGMTTRLFAEINSHPSFPEEKKTQRSKIFLARLPPWIDCII